MTLATIQVLRTPLHIAYVHFYMGEGPALASDWQKTLMLGDALSPQFTGASWCAQAAGLSEPAGRETEAIARPPWMPPPGIGYPPASIHGDPQGYPPERTDGVMA